MPRAPRVMPISSKKKHATCFICESPSPPGTAFPGLSPDSLAGKPRDGCPWGLYSMLPRRYNPDCFAPPFSFMMEPWIPTTKGFVHEEVRRFLGAGVLRGVVADCPAELLVQPDQPAAA